jgi:hypothetical protein
VAICLGLNGDHPPITKIYIERLHARLHYNLQRKYQDM